MKINESSTGVTKTYNSGTAQTTIGLPYKIYNTMQMVTRNVTGSSVIAGQIVPTVSQTAAGTDIVVSGDYSSSKFFIGEKFTFEYQFSQQYLQLSGAQSRTAVKEGRLQIRNWTVSYDNTGHFTVEITPDERDTTTETFNGTVVGSGVANGINLESGDYTFAVQSRNEGLVVKLASDEYLPCHFVNAEWQGYYNQTSSSSS